MFFPPPDNSNDHGISDKPLPVPKSLGIPSDGAHADDVPKEEELFDYVLDCMERGSSNAEIRKQLIAFGYSADDANQTVQIVTEWRRKNPTDQRYPDAPNIATPAAGGGDGSTNMLIGGLICVVGIVITVGTCMAAQNGGSYTIAWGAIVFGAIQFFRGMSQSNQR